MVELRSLDVGVDRLQAEARAFQVLKEIAVVVEQYAGDLKRFVIRSCHGQEGLKFSIR